MRYEKISLFECTLHSVCWQVNSQGYPNNTKIPEKITTPNHVDTRMGELEFYDGIPTDATLR
jgi:hypothetical protein